MNESGKSENLSASRLFRRLALIGLGILWWLPAMAAHSAAPDVRKIMEGVYQQDTSKDSTYRGTLEVVAKNGKTNRKSFTFNKVGSLGNSKTLVRFTDPVEVRGVGLLSLNQQGANERQWMFTPAIQRVRRIAPQERSRRFIGTDFTNEDMAERVLDDFTYKLLTEGEVIDGRKTYKIEGRPVSADRSQYQYVYLWVAQDIPYLVMAEYYDQDGKRIRLLKASQIEKIAGIWIARRLEMSTVAENTRSILVIDDVKFNTGLKEDLFTLQALEKNSD